MPSKLNWEKDSVRRAMQDHAHDRLWSRYSKRTRQAIRAAVMPWGKHKGRRLSAIPENYLTWLHDQRPDGDWLRQMIARELFRRTRAAHPSKNSSNPVHDRSRS